MNAFFKAVLIAVLTLTGLVGLGMSLCGGVVTFGGLLSHGNGGGGGEFQMNELWIISVPSLVIGLCICWAAFAGLRSISRASAKNTPGARDQGADPR